MMKVSIKVNMLDVKEVFANLEPDTEHPESPVIGINLELKETEKNLDYLLTSPLIKSWSYTECGLFDKENVLVIRRELFRREIKIKDMRNLIMLARSYYASYHMAGEKVPKLDDVINYFFTNQESLKEHVYEREFIDLTLNALSKATDPLSDFLERLEKTEIKETFEIYYKELYGNKE